MRTLFKYGGIIASVMLIVAGAVSIGAGALGVMQVRNALSAEKIVGSPDMTPTAITAAATEAGLNVATLDIPGQAVAGKTIDTGSEAQAFAGYMRIHALEASGGLTYAEMGRFVSAANPDDPAGTSDEAAAAKDENGQPVSNGPQHLGHRDSAHDRAEHLVLRRAGWHLHGCDRWGAPAHGHRVPVLMLGGALRPTPAETPVASQAKPRVQPASA